ncbi:MAG: filamentous hemagglutinin N-terminal domain-containing protein [Desulfobacteraceae bacterium]|nr:filamentous hemagglutinin N-terminal domain-containing protein [Desulfobacteraceae bacterium]
MKNYYLGLIPAVLFTIICVPAHSDNTHPHGITLDGTLGTAGKLALPGPDFDVKAEYGTQAGANLFHSFQKFNIHSNESATFSGPGSVQNIIGRVTGGDSSWIDGTLRSTIPGADLYLLNPAGLMFGPGALLDLGGSFHVSTADYLRMGDTEKFYAAPREIDVLSAANPAAFGFLDNNVAPITFEGGEAEPAGREDNSGLCVSKGNTISVIGGNIEIKGNIKAPEGRINIAGVASGGEAIPADSGTDVSSFDKMGDITISDKSLADVSGEGSGSVFIRGGRFFSDNSEINAETLGNKNGGAVDIRVGSLSFTNGASIITGTNGTGRGADTEIHATDSVAFSGERGNSDGSKIEAATKGAGDAGSLHIEASSRVGKSEALPTDSQLQNMVMVGTKSRAHPTWLHGCSYTESLG